MPSPSADTAAPAVPAAPPLKSEELLEIARACGADDCGLVSVDAPGLAEERRHIAKAFPGTRPLVSLVQRTNREPIRSPRVPSPTSSSTASDTASTTSPATSSGSWRSAASAR